MRARLLLAGAFLALFFPLLVLPADSATLEGLAMKALLGEGEESLYPKLLADREAGQLSSLDPAGQVGNLRIHWPPDRPAPTQEHVDALKSALVTQEVFWDARLRALEAEFPDLEGDAWLELQLQLEDGDRELLLVDPQGQTVGGQRLARRWSLVPPLIAIVLAFLTRSTVPSLLTGVLVGSFLAAAQGKAWYTGLSLFVVDILWHGILTDSFHLYILGFVLVLSATVTLVTRMGGIEGMVKVFLRWAKTRRSVQAVAYFLGMGIFFDDYANTMIVGNSTGPLFDRLKVSRAKLAYIVDSTAAPVAGVALLSTWVAYQISTYAPQLPTIGLSPNEGYSLFLETIPYRFYCLLALFMVGLVIFSQRDFGPMRVEEEAARQGRSQSFAGGEKGAENQSPAPGVKARWFNGVFPLFAVMVGFTAFLIFYLGAQEVAAAIAEGDAEAAALKEQGGFPYIREILKLSPSTKAIFFGSLAAFGTAFLLAIGQRLLPLKDIAVTSARGLSTLFKDAVLILILAWSIAKVCEHLGTAGYLVATTQDLINPLLLPIILFITSCFVAFSTGSSWATMAIMQPNVVLLAHRLGDGSPLGSHGLLVLSIGAVLEGAIFGDHCSPISDTTVLSSIASRCKHIEHVRTQAPYALLVAAVALAAGYFPTAFFQVSPWMSLAVGAVGLGLFVRFRGKPFAS